MNSYPKQCSLHEEFEDVRYRLYEIRKKLNAAALQGRIDGLISSISFIETLIYVNESGD
jgi:hypothetical protein